VTYFGFLALFVGLPVAVLSVLNLRDARPGNGFPGALTAFPVWLVLAAHVLIAVLYTTPWDNYLVATGVWWYDPGRVTGLTLGWVPIEEYTFFVLQSVLAGLWFIFIARRLGFRQAAPVASNAELRRSATAAGAVVWVVALTALVAGWTPGTYLSLILIWALPPVLLQLAFGADILWRWRQLVLWSIAPLTLYLCAADAIAIRSGTWTIDPAQSTGLFVGGLPVEEAVFFLSTNTLLVFGMTLVLSTQSLNRVRPLVAKLSTRFGADGSPGNEYP
jgi:lycopene cyclase domain-containing protein